MSRTRVRSVVHRFCAARERGTFVAIAGIVLLTAVAGCGAKSGLRVPCLTPLIRSHPDVVFALDRSGSMAMVAADGRSYWNVLIDTSADVLPLIEEDMNLGATTFPWGHVALGDVNCATLPAIGVSPATHNASAVLQFLRSAGDPSGSTPTFDALAVAAAALRDRSTSPRRFIALGTDGGPDCNADITPDTCDCFGSPAAVCFGPPIPGGSACNDITRVVAQLSAFREEGILTLVIGIVTSGDAALAQSLERGLNLMSEAGGAPVSVGPHQYYRADTPSGLRDAMDSAVLPLSYCRLRVPSAARLAEDAVLFGGVAGSIARDRSNTDGWNWTDRATGELSLVGPSCARVVATRASVSAADSSRMCETQ